MRSKRPITLLLIAVLNLVLAQAPMVENAWVRLTPPTLKDTAAYMVIVNPSDKPLRLVGGETDVAMMVMPMIFTVEIREQGGVKMEVKGMKSVPYLEVPAKGRLELEPGGNHLMLMGLKRALKEGERVKITLRFQGGLKLVLEAPVLTDAPK